MRAFFGKLGGGRCRRNVARTIGTGEIGLRFQRCVTTVYGSRFENRHVTSAVPVGLTAAPEYPNHSEVNVWVVLAQWKSF